MKDSEFFRDCLKAYRGLMKAAPGGHGAVDLRDDALRRRVNVRLPASEAEDSASE